MDGPVHPNESWLPSCVSNDDERILSAKDAGQHVSQPPPPPPTTYTQLKSVCNQVNTTSSSIVSGVNMLKSPVDVDIISLGDHKESNLKNLRPHSTPATLLWLEENYETAEGVCIPRSTLYMHYVDFCDRNGMQPVNAASFGKIIRQQFPHLTTRRLGTRGQSRYHYYGIAVKESSTYYDVSYSKRGGSSLHESKKEPLKQTPTYSQRTKIGALLPDFTHFKDLNLPPNIPEEKVSTFLMMYRTHCQRILDTVIRASFDEVQNFLLHFWKGMPSHISSILSSNAIVNVVGVCDSFVYKAISNVLFPSVHQALPDSLIQVIRKFSKDLTVWLRMALDDIPDNLRELKFDLAKCFSRTLRRQTSLNHLCQASRLVIHNSDITAQMLQDWRNVDLDGVSRQTLFTMDGQTDIGGASVELITSLYKEFETLLEDQAPIEAYMEWLESLVDRCVVQPSRKRKCSIRRLARQFLLMWSSFGTRVIRDMTLHSAPSFGSFHLLHLTFDDYVLFLVESLHWEERTQELFANIPNDAPPTLNDTMIDDAVVDSEVGMSKLKWYSSQPHGGADHTVSTSSMPIASPSSHSHASSCDVMAQNSPVQNALDSSMSINDDAKPPETPGGDTEPMITEYTPMTPEQYPSSYHYDTQDNRGLYNYSAAAAAVAAVASGGGGGGGGGGGVGGRQESRSTYSCHPGNQYIMNNPGVETQEVDCTGARNLVATNTPRSNGESVGNGNVEYANFVQYPSSRRGEYSECHGYVYEQPATSIIYTPTNCYYQPYEVTGNATTLCCSPRYPIRSESTSPNKMERGGIVDPKLQEGVGGGGGGGIIYSVTSTGNGRG